MKTLHVIVATVNAGTGAQQQRLVKAYTNSDSAHEECSALGWRRLGSEHKRKLGGIPPGEDIVYTVDVVELVDD